MRSRPDELRHRLESYRARPHRTLAGRALKSPVEARDFVREMKIIAQTWDDDLPSLFGAAQGKPYKPEAGGWGACACARSPKDSP